jgi:hypothetical protein
LALPNYKNKDEIDLSDGEDAKESEVIVKKEEEKPKARRKSRSRDRDSRERRSGRDHHDSGSKRHRRSSRSDSR